MHHRCARFVGGHAIGDLARAVTPEFNDPWLQW